MLSAMSLATNESVNQSPARSSPTRAFLLVLQGVFALVAVSMPSAARAQDLARDEDCCGGLHARSDLVFSCHPSVRSRINSVLQGGPLLVEAAADEPTALFNPWPFFTVQYTGSSANRIDIVFVGDLAQHRTRHGILVRGHRSPSLRRPQQSRGRCELRA